MQFHLIAFAPFAILAGTALMSVIVLIAIQLTTARVAAPKAAVAAQLKAAMQVAAVARRSADILYFPAPKMRQVQPSGNLPKAATAN